MRVSLRSALGWLFPLAYLALPNCSFTGSGPAEANLSRGAVPRRTALMCDIQRPLSRRCANAKDLAVGIRMASAAVALARNQKSTIGLDYSPEALAQCGGQPQAVDFYCAYPEGCPVCVNCGVIGPSPLPYADQDAVCAEQCEDLFGAVVDAGVFAPDINDDGGTEPDPGTAVEVYCAANARASTNMESVDPCSNLLLSYACSPAGAVSPDQMEPRRAATPVKWRDKIGVTTSGSQHNTITRTTPPGTPADYDAGAASMQYVTQGDGHVDFTALATDSGRALGLSSGNGPDADPTLNGIGHAVRVSPGGEIFIHQQGVQVVGPNPPNGHWATHAAGDRIRVAWTDNFGSPRTATVSYRRIPAGCSGELCDGYLIYSGGTVQYPFRVDASIRHLGAALNGVRIVYVK